MSYLFLLPGLISLLLVMRGKVNTAFLWVYLPALILVPNGFAARIPHVPPISAAQAALIPIGIVALFRLAKNGFPSFMDILVFLFVASVSVTEVLRERVTNDGLFVAADAFLSIFVAYAVGRTIIEPDLRKKTVKHIVVLMLLLGPFGLVEWRLGQNVYGLIGQSIFHLYETHAAVQYRAGHGRMSASFNDAELAGIAIGMTLALNSWLVFLAREQGSTQENRVIRWIERFHIPGVLLLLYLLATQSRGPLVAMSAAWLVLQLSKFKKRRVALLGIALVLGGGVFWGYTRYIKYTSVATAVEIADEMQGSAVYRRRMNTLYEPIADAGGWLGWSKLSHPVVPGMVSIDNEYLLVHISYGWSGFTIFLLIALETNRKLIVQIWRRQPDEEQILAVSVLSAMAVFWLAIYTVYMGEQLPQFAFLLIGWSRTFRPAERYSTETVPVVASKFAFRRVYE
jgi:hypothetical protein